MDPTGATGTILRTAVTSAASGAALRQEVRHRLADGGVAPAVIGDVLLVLSELVTNALDASPPGGVVAVEVTVLGPTVRVVVENAAGTGDDGGRRAHLATVPVSMPPPTSGRGRGLPLVAALANRVAVDVDGPVTAVQAEVWAGAQRVPPSGRKELR